MEYDHEGYQDVKDEVLSEQEHVQDDIERPPKRQRKKAQPDLSGYAPEELEAHLFFYGRASDDEMVFAPLCTPLLLPVTANSEQQC